MVLRPPRLAEEQHGEGLLHPGLPLLLLSSQISGRTRAAGRPSPGALQPRADASTPPRDGGSSSASRGASTTSSNTIKPSISFPRPPAGGAAIGLGAGGAIYAGGGGAAKATALMPYSNAPPEREASSKTGQKRLLIMMSNTGGGHRASAEAIRDAFKEKHGEEYQIDIVDMWKDHTPWPFNKLPDTYAFLVKHSILWRMSYQMTQPKWFHIPYFAFVGLFLRSHIHRAFDKYQPDMVVSVHPLMQHVPIRVIKQRVHSGAMQPVNFATVVTDFTTCHNTWFHTSSTRCFVPTDECRALAKRNGLVDDQLIQRGLPIRPLFSRELPNRRAMRRRLGLDPSLPAILLVGGGEGMGALEATVSELGKELGPSAQTVVICGRNARLFERLCNAPPPGGMPIRPTGFVNNIHEWMGACDCIITKAGPGTIAEALISGLPILLNGNVPCQEEGNIPFVIDNGVGTFEKQPAKIAKIIRTWLCGTPEEQEKFTQMGQRAKELGRPMAVYEIMEDLKDLTDQPYLDFGPARESLPKDQRKPQKQKQRQQKQKSSEPKAPAFPPAAAAAAAKAQGSSPTPIPSSTDSPAPSTSASSTQPASSHPASTTPSSSSSSPASPTASISTAALSSFPHPSPTATSSSPTLSPHNVPSTSQQPTSTNGTALPGSAPPFASLTLTPAAAAWPPGVFDALDNTPESQPKCAPFLFNACKPLQASWA